MSLTLVFNIATVQNVSYAPGTVLGGYSIGIQIADGSSPPVVQKVADLSQPIRFPDVAAGRYMAGVTRLDAAEIPVGSPGTFGPFDVPDSITPPQDVLGDGPGAITVSFE